MNDLLTVILPVFVVIGAGYGAVAMGWFSDSGVDGLMLFSQRFAIPALLFMAIAGLDLGAEFDWRLLASFYSGATVCFLVGIFAARALFFRPAPDSIAIGFACLFSNSLLLGLAITERAYGPDALQANFAIIAVHAPFCYGVGVAVMETTLARRSKASGIVLRVIRSMFSNALVLGIAAGFLVNFSGLPLPVFLSDGLNLLVRAALPAALFGLGGVLYRYRPEGDAMTIAMICAVSLLLHPAIVWTVGNWLDLPRDAFRSAVITAAMAPGINAYLFANMYGVARRVVASAALVGTALTVFTAWMWLSILP
ncbi:MAG: AEC family transporter [Pseudomonadota bacterium]